MVDVVPFPVAVPVAILVLILLLFSLPAQAQLPSAMQPGDTLCRIVTDRERYGTGDTITISATSCHFEGCAMPQRPIEWYEGVMMKAGNSWITPMGSIPGLCRALLPTAHKYGDRTINITLTKPGTYRFAIYGSRYYWRDFPDKGLMYSNEFVVEERE